MLDLLGENVIAFPDFKSLINILRPQSIFHFDEVMRAKFLGKISLIGIKHLVGRIETSG